MTYCADCGTGLPEDSRFCSDCGTTIEQIPNSRPNILPLKTSPVQEFIDSIPKPAVQQTYFVEEKNNSRKEDFIYCRNCSNPLNPKAFACTKCGLPPLKGKDHCQCCGASSHREAVICVKCGVMLETPPENKVIKVEPQPAVYHQPIQHQPQQYIQPQHTTYTQQNITIIGRQKSVGTAFLLAFLFGPLGLLYATVSGGLIMLVITIVVGVVTLGVGTILTWVVCIVWAIAATQEYNRKMEIR